MFMITGKQQQSRVDSDKSRAVSVYGVEFRIPTAYEYKWAAVDKDGYLRLFVERPRYSAGDEEFFTDTGMEFNLCIVYYTGDPRDSVVQLPAE